MELPLGCKAFGIGSSSLKIDNWLRTWGKARRNFNFLLVLAGSRTAEVKGISAAGATAESRRYTAIADAELLLKGPDCKRSWPLPPLAAGVSPALISFVSARWIGIEPLVIAVGLEHRPSFPHLCLELPSFGPANCLSTGKAMDVVRVQGLWEKGLLMGRKMREPLLIAESVPGGTTTAQAILTGLGLSVKDLISGSLRNPPMDLKNQLVSRGLFSAQLTSKPLPHRLIAAVGDPFQAVAVGLLIGAREAGQEVFLGGGSQMLAVLALALEATKLSNRAEFINGVVVGTTAWLVEEGQNSSRSSSPFLRLMEQVSKHFEVDLLGVASGLRFHSSKRQTLRDYELGFVKEGVGAGALSLLAQVRGASCKDLIDNCERAVDSMRVDFIS